jgi:hypothetical protein
MRSEESKLPENLLAKQPQHENGKLKPGCYLITHTLDVVRAKEREKLCLFTTPMWEAYSGDYRLTDEHTVSAVLESSLKKFRWLQSTQQSTAGIILQVPVRYTERRKGIWLAIVPDESQSNRYQYCAKYGLREV